MNRKINQLINGLEDNILYILAIGSEIEGSRFILPNNFTIVDPLTCQQKLVKYDHVPKDTTLAIHWRIVNQVIFTAVMALCEECLKLGETCKRKIDVQNLTFKDLNVSDNYKFDALRIILYQIRNIWAHTPWYPVWKIRINHKIKIEIKDLGLIWDGENLHTQKWDISHIGGYFGVLHMDTYLKNNPNF